tara:strand:+ start:2304 stop:2918 length:615 start_codon:yes stop_codon:yes gene_type:complete
MEQAIEEITQTLKTTVIPNFVDILSKKYVDMVSEKFNIPKDELNKCTKPLIEQLIKSEFTSVQKQTPKLKIQVDINKANEDDVSEMGREQLRNLCEKYGLPKKRSNDDNRKLIREYLKKNTASSSANDSIAPTPIDEAPATTTNSLPITTPTEIFGYEDNSGDDSDEESPEIIKQRNLILKHTKSISDSDELEEEDYSDQEDED